MTPSRLDPAPFAGVAGRMLLIPGEYGPTAETGRRAEPLLPGARQVILDYEAQSWVDTAKDYTGELAAAMTGFLMALAADAPKAGGAGEHAAVTHCRHTRVDPGTSRTAGPLHKGGPFYCVLSLHL